MEETIDQGNGEAAMVVEAVSRDGGEEGALANGPQLEQEQTESTPSSAKVSLGSQVRKKFGKKYYKGTVAGYEPETNWYKVIYEDGDSEELELAELEPLLASTEEIASRKRRGPASASKSGLKKQKTKPLELLLGDPAQLIDLNQQVVVEAPIPLAQRSASCIETIVLDVQTGEVENVRVAEEDPAKNVAGDEQLEVPAENVAGGGEGPEVAAENVVAGGGEEEAPAGVEGEVPAQVVAEVTEEAPEEAPEVHDATVGGAAEEVRGEQDADAALGAPVDAADEQQPKSGKKGKKAAKPKSAAKKVKAKAQEKIKTPRKRAAAGEITTTPRKSSRLTQPPPVAEVPAEEKQKKASKATPPPKRKSSAAAKGKRLERASEEEDEEEEEEEEPRKFKAHDRGVKLRGRKLEKDFDGKRYNGKVAGYDRQRKFYKIHYEDGDEEELEWKEVEPLLIALEEEEKEEDLAGTSSAAGRKRKQGAKAVTSAAAASTPRTTGSKSKVKKKKPVTRSNQKLKLRSR